MGVEDDRSYWRDLAEVRRKRVNRLAIALMVVTPGGPARRGGGRRP